MKVTMAALVAALNGDLENAIIASTPGGIEAQEAREQKRLVASTMLPKEVGYDNTREQFEAIGIVFGKDVDDLFVECVIPAGWTKRPTEHSMWSELVDDKGRVRAQIFYKGAFYDRNAHISLSRRFAYGIEPEGGWDNECNRETVSRYVLVKDMGNGTIIWKSDLVAPDEICPWYMLSEKLSQIAREWLAEHYPDWENPLAYWDE